MTREHEGHYKSKHSIDTSCDPAIAAAIREKEEAGQISCVSAFAVARDLETTPAEVGRTMDLLECKLFKCQLGLFGYPENKVVKPARSVPAPLQAAIDAKAENKRLSCKACWEIADHQNIPRMHVAAVCETLGIKIKPCQLGAF
ncbi:MAG: hypothetical protein SWH68_10475 [Thermodesulfobacteriota bacterium]|nr:hypothetical protein [Thermodesulfobacteriota bacterium]